MKKAWFAIALVAVAAVAAWLMFARRGDAADSYRFVNVERGDVISTVSCTGNLEATQTVEVGTQVSGQIAEIYVDFNDRVQKGQLLARIDPTILEQEIRSAEAALERSQAELDQALRELERNRPLQEQQLIPERDWNTLQYQTDVARASFKAAEIGLEKARRNLGYSEIRSPIDGIVLGRLVDVGQTVAASLSAPQMFLLAGDLSKMQILASVDESDIGKVFVGQEARFTVQAHPDRTFAGQVSQIRLQSAVTENVVSYTVVIELENRDNLLLPGMTATVELVVAKATGVFKVANAALRFRATEEMRAQVRSRRESASETAGGGVAGVRDRAAGSESASESGRDRGAGASGGRSDQVDRSAGSDRSSEADRGAGGAARGDGGAGARDASGGGARDGSEGADGADRGARGGSGDGTGSGSRGGDRAILWTVQAGRLEVISVRTGITDGQSTVVEGEQLEEGMPVIAAVTTGTASSSPSPFGGQQQPGPGRFRGGF